MSFRLLSDAELLDEGSVAIQIILLKVSKKASSLTNHHEKTTSLVVILRVLLKVLSELVDTCSQNGDLNLW